MNLQAPHVHQVFDWLWTSGQLSAQDIAALPALGVKAVITLAAPASTGALAGEAERVARHGMAYVNVPVEWARPEPDQLLQFFGLLKAYEGNRVWVHCILNMRVSAFVYLYRRLCLSQPDEIACHPMQAVWEPDATWPAFIERALRARPSGAGDWHAWARDD